MKKIFLFLGLLIGSCPSLFAQNINMTESELESFLIKQWEIEYAMMGSMKIGQMPGAKDFDFLFKKDGKYDLIEDNGTIRTGMWEYVTENKYVELSVDGKITSRIKSIDKNKLILTMVSGKNDPAGLPNVEIHFKPF